MANKKSTPGNFTSILADVDATPTSSAPEKGPLLSYRIDPDLKIMLDRVVFWRGKNGGSQRQVINEALRTMFENDPTAQRPMPGE